MAEKKVSRNAQRLLTVREVMAAKDGDHSDGGGVYLRIRGDSASWVFRYTSPTGKRREMGLGGAIRHDAEAAGKRRDQARKDADAARELLVAGKDPIDERAAVLRGRREAAVAAKTEAKAQSMTLARVARAYHEKFIEGHLNDKHAATWIGSLERYLPEEIWHKAIAKVGAGELLDALVDLHTRLPETASRVRQRLEAVYDDAMLRELVPANPAAAIRRKLTERRKRTRVVHFRQLPYADAPDFFAAICAQEGGAACGLRLLMLTATRTNEVLGAVKSEFNLERAEWIIPGDRMKGGEDHVVHLSAAALAIVKHQLEDVSNPTQWLFPSPTGNDMSLSNMAFLQLVKRMHANTLTTPHGLRGTFSTWANETNQARKDVIEATLAHKEADKVRAAYNHAQYAADRRALLEKWAAYLTGIETSNTTTADEFTAA